MENKYILQKWKVCTIWLVSSLANTTIMACFLCSEIENSELCSRCKKVTVCKNHEKLHGNSEVCFPFKVDHHKYKGRILISTRNIEAGEVIFEEKPLFSGPAKSSNPICLNCLGSQAQCIF